MKFGKIIIVSIIILIISTFMVGCKDKKENNTDVTTVEQTTTILESKEFLDSLTGTWIKKSRDDVALACVFNGTILEESYFCQKDTENSKEWEERDWNLIFNATFDDTLKDGYFSIQYRQPITSDYDSIYDFYFYLDGNKVTKITDTMDGIEQDGEFVKVSDSTEKEAALKYLKKQ